MKNLRPIEPRSHERSLPREATRQHRAGQIGIAKTGAAQVGAFQHHFAQVGTREIRAAQIRAGIRHGMTVNIDNWQELARVDQVMREFPNSTATVEASLRPVDDDREVVRVVDAEIPRAYREARNSVRDQGDIAVIRLEGKLPKGYHAAHLGSSRTPLHAGDTLILAGYGISNAREHTGAGRLRRTSVKILDPDFGKTEMLLDQSRGSGACHGDSGGPAFLEKDGKLILVGVTDRGHPASAPDDCKHQVVYAKVPAYRKWISETIKTMRGSKP